MRESKKSQEAVLKSSYAIPGTTIAQARLKRNWTQHDLAARSGIKRVTVAYRERQTIVRPAQAAEFDRAFGGSNWRTQSESGAPVRAGGLSGDALLRQLIAQVAEIQRHVLTIERNMMYRRRTK